MVVAHGVSVASAIDSTQRPPVLTWSATTTRRVTVDKASVGADGFRDDFGPTERVGAAADEAPPATLGDGAAACFRRHLARDCGYEKRERRSREGGKVKTWR